MVVEQHWDSSMQKQHSSLIGLLRLTTLRRLWIPQARSSSPTEYVKSFMTNCAASNQMKYACSRPLDVRHNRLHRKVRRWR